MNSGTAYLMSWIAHDVHECTKRYFAPMSFMFKQITQRRPGLESPSGAGRGSLVEQKSDKDKTNRSDVPAADGISAQVDAWMTAVVAKNAEMIDVDRRSPDETNTTQIEALLQYMVTDEEYKLDQIVAVANAKETFKRMLEDKCSLSVAFPYATSLAARPGSDTAPRLAVALGEFPTVVVKLIAETRHKSQRPTTRADVFLLGKKLMFYIEQIIYSPGRATGP
jgi:hypothetical protein